VPTLIIWRWCGAIGVVPSVPPESVPPESRLSKALVKGLARELGIDESYLEKLAAEVRKYFG
jgi:hypothetical protein